MPNASANLTNANVPTRSFGSEHDPVLDGVTRGLETLFPPFYQPADADLGLEPVRDAQPTPHEGCAGVQARRKHPSLPTVARPHEAGEHGTLPRH